MKQNINIFMETEFKPQLSGDKEEHGGKQNGGTVTGLEQWAEGTPIVSSFLKVDLECSSERMILDVFLTLILTMFNSRVRESLG